MTQLPKDHGIVKLAQLLPKDKNELTEYLFDLKKYARKEDYQRIYDLVQSVESLADDAAFYQQRFEYYRSKAGELLQEVAAYQPEAVNKPLTITNVVKHNAEKKLAIAKDAAESAAKTATGLLPYIAVGAGALLVWVAYNQAKRVGVLA